MENPYNILPVPEELGKPLFPGTRSLGMWGGRNLNPGSTTQGGGPILAGGIGGPRVTGDAPASLAKTRGLSGGPGMRGIS